MSFQFLMPDHYEGMPSIVSYSRSINGGPQRAISINRSNFSTYHSAISRLSQSHSTLTPLIHILLVDVIFIRPKLLLQIRNSTKISSSRWNPNMHLF
jgi:hypothetical protein